MKKHYTSIFKKAVIFVCAVLFAQNVFAQAFTFNSIPAQTYGGATFAPGATAPSGTITYTSSNAAVATIVAGDIQINGAGTSTITATNGTTQLTQTLTVNKASLTLTAASHIVIQGTRLPVLTLTYSGFVNGDTQAEFTTQPTVSTKATATSGMGYYPITVSGGSSADYTFTYVPGTLTVVSVAYLTAPVSKAYGTAAFYTFGSATSGITYSSGNTSVATVNPSTGLITIIGAGTATIAFGTGSGQLGKTLTVTPAPLTVTANNQLSVQGAPLQPLTLSYSGFVNGDTPAEFTTAPTATTTATFLSGAGIYPITVSGGSSVDYTFTYVPGTLVMTTVALLTAPVATVYGSAGFYTAGYPTTGYTYSSSIPAVATVSATTGFITILTPGLTSISVTYDGITLTKGVTVHKAPLTVTADNQTKESGTVNPVLTVSYSGFINGDTNAEFTAQPTVHTTATTLSPVGTYPIKVSGGVSADYSLTDVAGTLTVTAAPLIFATIPATVYGTPNFSPGATSPAPITYTSSNPAVATIVSGNIHTVGVGTSIITASTSSQSVTQTLTVTPAPLTITAVNKTKIYGTGLPAFTITYSGFITGDSPAVVNPLPGVTSTATAASPVGSYPITPAGAVAANYAITYVTGALTITPVKLTITATNKIKVYGAAIPSFVETYSGFVNGDTPASLITQPVLGTTATAASPVGSYPITGSGAVDGNYSIAYVPGTLTVTNASLIITAVNQVSTYGAALPVFTVSYSGFVNGDTPAAVTTPAVVATTATAASPVGTYPIKATGAIVPNYTIAYTAGVLAVGRAPLTITAVNQTKMVGTANPTLTAAYTGLVNGDTPASLTTAPVLSTKATISSAIGTYVINVGGAADANYVISYVNGTLTVTASGLALHIPVTADNTSTDLALVPKVNIAVSPNGDGVNDVLTISNIDKYPNNKLALMNQNGAKIFEVSNYDNINHAFDGHSNINGKLQHPGTYFYMLQYSDNGIVKSTSGYIVLKY